jgi:molybdopterin/thiamine biosynthesis adenylyltransferase
MTRQLNQAGLLPQTSMNEYAIAVVGLGAIGSFVTMSLTKMGFKKIIAWDHDSIEEHNIANQMFPVTSVGTKKAIATRAMVNQFSGESIQTLAIETNGKRILTALTKAYPYHKYIVILCVDSLDVRKKIVTELQERAGIEIIDARMGALTYRVLNFNTAYNEEFSEYIDGLVPDADAVQERCGQKSIIYTVLGVAAEVCSFVHKIVMNTGGRIVNEPVVFDYGSGVRLQKRTATGELVVVGDDHGEFI